MVVVSSLSVTTVGQSSLCITVAAILSCVLCADRLFLFSARDELIVDAVFESQRRDLTVAFHLLLLDK